MGTGMSLLGPEISGFTGRGSFFCSIRCVQTASWLSTASNLAASTALGLRRAHRKITTYLKTSRAQFNTLPRLQKRFRSVFIAPRCKSCWQQASERKFLSCKEDGVFRRYSQLNPKTKKPAICNRMPFIPRASLWAFWHRM